MLYGNIDIPGRPDPENVRRLGLLPLPMIRRMQRVGIAIDREWLWRLGGELETRKTELVKSISSYVPRGELDAFVGESGDDLLGELNVESAEQIAELLFSRLKIGHGERLKQTKSGRRISTGKKQLEGLKWRHPIIPLILEYRECSKLKSTYADALPQLARFHNRGECSCCGLRHWEDHWRIHTELPTTRTDTDRLASRRPNLQNIPARTRLGREIRKAFMAEPGTKLVAADYSQIELRLLADRAGERNMIRIFREGLDIHADTAMRAFKIDLATVLSDEGKLLYRAPCKNVNFGVCIAEGQRVLTSRGLVPIEKVLLTDLVWDGMEWVGHEGVVFKGAKDVITWDGLTATPDHQVWSREGRKSTLAENQHRGRYLAVTEVEGLPIRFPQDYFDQHSSTRRLSSRLDRVRRVRAHSRTSGRQYPRWQDHQLQMCMSQILHTEGAAAGRPILFDSAALFESSQRKLVKLRSTGYREPVFISGRVRSVRHSQPSSSELQESGYWQNQQRWPLRAGEYQTGNPSRESAEHTTQQKKQARVYDIMNAGPRRRFTCEGKLVSNCYGLSASGLYDLMMVTFATAGVAIPDWLTYEWCEEFIETWFNLYPDAHEYFDLQHWRARRYGITWCLFGGVRRIPEVRSTHEKVIAAGLRQAGNNPIQRGAAGVMKIGMARVEDRFAQMRADGMWVEALLPIHDELVSQVAEDWADEVKVIVEAEMAKALVDEHTGELRCRVPVLTDGKVMDRWVKS